MYLFKDKEILEIPYSCKVCLKEIKFKITADEYKAVVKFPIKKELLHGDPPHKLIIYLNQYLEVENFEIKDVLKVEEVAYSEELTKQVLGEIGLNNEEIELYFRTTGREAVSIGEMALLINKPKDYCEGIAKKFVEKGLFKEIVGAKPHYTALPPYAALISQLQKFHKYISDIKASIPAQLNKSFTTIETTPAKVAPADSTKLMKELKDNMLSQIRSQKKEFDDTMAVMDQIRGITEDISKLEGTAQTVTTDDLGDVSKKFENINQKTNQIIKGQISELKNEFDNIKSTVSSNLQKLRLGVISQTVDQVLEKIIDAKLKEISDAVNVQLSVSQMAFSDELKKATTGIDPEVITKLKDSLQSTIKNIDGLATKVEEDKEKIYADIAENFNKAVKAAEDKIEGISGGVIESFGDMRDVFSNQIVSTLNSTLDDILQKLEVSERVTSEFWNQAKKGTGFTMKDIWFIRSPESAKAHINDEISKAKMRVLIVAPQLTDIDIEAIKNRPSRINFRIATSIDPTNPTHQSIIERFDSMDNVDYRHRALQNLWGINKDYEEVVVCVLSKTEIRGDVVTEIAGIGSIIEEHIKIFVPILEDAWMSSRKEIVHAVKKEILEKSEAPKPAKNVKQKVKEEPQREVPTPTVESKSLLSKQFDLVSEGLDKMTGLEISKALEKFQTEYINKEGYNSVLKNVNNTSNDLKSKTYVLSQPEKEDLKMKMQFWKQKLNL
ncbi:MAG: hypothetical protein ACXACC_04590 [Promethearchaeota archaeon]|jgi:hypothetical protein